MSIKIQKDSDTPIYERDDIVTSENFDVEIQESGTYKITVIGENTKGGVSFKKVDGEKAEQEETQQGISEKTIDLSGAFQEINGCAVIYSPVQEEYSFFNEDMCRQEVSPYSTFKIISALLGLQKGVIVDESSTMGYDGMDYGNAEWNGDLTLEEAFQNSCIWYFREVIDLVGKALQEMGIAPAVSKTDNETTHWQEREREYIKGLCLEREIEVEILGVKRDNYTIPEYKAAMHATEELTAELEILNAEKQEAESVIASVGAEIADAREEVEESKKHLDEINEQIADKEILIYICWRK